MVPNQLKQFMIPGEPHSPRYPLSSAYSTPWSPMQLLLAPDLAMARCFTGARRRQSLSVEFISLHKHTKLADQA